MLSIGIETIWYDQASSEYTELVAIVQIHS